MNSILLVFILLIPIEPQKPIAVYDYSGAEVVRISDAPNPRWGGRERQWGLNSAGVPSISFVDLDKETKRKRRTR